MNTTFSRPAAAARSSPRTTAAELSKVLGQSVYVENKPGGAGNVAMQEVAARRPAHHHPGPHRHAGGQPFIFDKLPYDPVKDFRRSRCWPRCPACTWCGPTCR